MRTKLNLQRSDYLSQIFENFIIIKLKYNFIVNSTLILFQGNLPSIIVNNKLYKIRNNAFVQTPITYQIGDSMVSLIINGEEIILKSFIDKSKVILSTYLFC